MFDDNTQKWMQLVTIEINTEACNSMLLAAALKAAAGSNEEIDVFRQLLSEKGKKMLVDVANAIIVRTSLAMNE